MGEQREANLVFGIGSINRQGRSARCFTPLHGQEMYRVSGLALAAGPDSRYRKPTNYWELGGLGQGVRPVADGAPHRMRPPTDPPSGGGPFPG